MLAKMDSFQEEMKTSREMTARMGAKADGNLKEMKEELSARLKARIEAETKPNKEKLEVLRSTFGSQIDIHQVRTEAIQKEFIAKMDAQQERMGASMNDLRNRSNGGLSGD
jgi:hypothetical protein